LRSIVWVCFSVVVFVSSKRIHKYFATVQYGTVWIENMAAISHRLSLGFPFTHPFVAINICRPTVLVGLKIIIAASRAIVSRSDG
jgi:hypothetical protein